MAQLVARLYGIQEVQGFDSPRVHLFFLLMNKVKILQKIITLAFKALFLALPLIVSPVSFELFEFSKIVFLYSLTLIVLSAWLAKIIIQQQFNWPPGLFFWPIIIFLLTQVVGTVFSIHPFTSVFGYYTRQNGGLLSYLAYSILCFAAINNLSFQQLKSLFRLSLISTIVIAIYAILQHFGLDNYLWQQNSQARVFSTLGQPNWLAAWLVIIIFLPLSTLAPLKALLLFAAFYTTLLFTRSRSGFIAFTVSFALYHIGIKTINKANKKIFLGSVLLIILLSFLFLTPFPAINRYFQHWSPTNPDSLPQSNPTVSLQKTELGSATGDIREVVWQGAWQLGKNRPLLGYGPATFAYSYYQARPLRHNLLSEWNFLYNKAHNEYLNFWAESGIVGLGSYLTLIVFLLFYAGKIIYRSRSLFLLALLAGFIANLLTNFFGFSTVATNFLFFMILVAFAVKQSSPATKTVVLPRFYLISLAIFFLLGQYWLGRYWWADCLFAKSYRLQHQAQPNYIQAQSYYQKAIQTNPFQPRYTNYAANNIAHVALALQQMEEKKQARQLSQKSHRLAKLTLQKNSHHLSHYLTQYQTYFLLGSIKDQYLTEAQSLLYQAQTIAPTDPRLPRELARLAKQENNLLEQIAQLEKTIRLKPNWEEAYLALARAYQQANQPQKARQAAEFILENINPENKEAQEIVADMN